MSWLKAKTYCENLGAHLAEVPDELTQVLLRDIANTLPDHSWWLGATDSETVSTVSKIYTLIFSKYNCQYITIWQFYILKGVFIFLKNWGSKKFYAVFSIS